MNSPILRWGILGTAGIARKNWLAIRLSGNGVVVAVASRDLQKAAAFIAACQAAAPFAMVPQAFGSYEALLASPDVDAVYIPLPTGLRQEWVIRAAAAGKHVVCEKPCAPDAAGLREMLAACHTHRVHFMDGVMFRHNERLARMRAILDDPTGGVGPLRRVESAFSFPAPDGFLTQNIRAQSALEPLGCLGDLGWYCIQISLWAAGWRLPVRVTGRMLSGHRSPEHVPMEFSGELLFADGLSAGFFCSFLAGNQQWAHFSGEQGRLLVDDFVLPYAGDQTTFELRDAEFQITGCDFHLQPRVRQVAVAEHGHGHATAQESKLFRNFADQVLAGANNDTWPSLALKTQLVLDACLASAVADGQPVPVPGV